MLKLRSRPIYSIEKVVKEDNGDILRLASIKVELDNTIKKEQLLIYERIDKLIKDILITKKVPDGDIYLKIKVEDMKDINTPVVIAGTEKFQLGVMMYGDMSFRLFITEKNGFQMYNIYNLTDYLNTKQIFYKKIENSMTTQEA